MGKNGSSDAFLQGVQDCLAANEYVKVKLSGGCMMELEEAKDLFIQACDATCVHTIGFTFILFRYTWGVPLRFFCEGSLEGFGGGLMWKCSGLMCVCCTMLCMATYVQCTYKFSHTLTLTHSHTIF